MHLYLIRHTSLNVAAGVCYGQSDVAVSDHFQIEQKALVEKLAHIQFDAVYTSPLQRCAQLAQALNKGAIKLDARLKELNFGDWEMQAWEAIPREIFDTWAANYAHLSPPNGESFFQLNARCKAFVEEVSKHSHGQHVAVVTHGGVIRAILAEALNMPLNGLFRIVVDHASVTHISYDEAVPKVRYVNR